MATKWKNFTRNCWVKAVACLLILVLTGVSAWQTVVFYMYELDNEDAEQLIAPMMLFSDDLPDSYPMNMLSSAAYHLGKLAQLSDENTIKAGKAIDEKDLCYLLYGRFYDDYYRDTTYEVEFDEETGLPSIRTVYPAESGAVKLENTPSIDNVISTVSIYDELREEYSISDNELSIFRTWLESNPGVFAVCQQEIISEQLENLSAWRERVNDITGVDYYIYNKSTGTTLQNIDAASAEDAEQAISLTSGGYSYLCSLDDAQRLSYTGESVSDESVSDFYDSEAYTDLRFEEGDIVLIGLKNRTLTNMQNTWIDATGHFRQFMLALIVSAVLILLCLVVLVCGAGWKTAGKTPQLIPADRIWTEVQCTVAILATCLLIAVVGNMLDAWNYLSTDVIYTLAIGTSVLVVAVLLMILLSQVRRIKAKQWLNGWIIWRLLYQSVGRMARWLGKGLRSLRERFRKTPLHRRLILICILVPLACAFWFTIPFIIAGALYFGMRTADRFELVCDGARNIRAGKPDTRITINGGCKEIQALADDLNGISDGLQEAVSTAVKSERLKSELISNVSHDIKTPLTSIITYIDLLKRCDISDPAAQEYISTLDQKAKRLQTLTLDLFDASKATSGAMQVELAKTDFDALLRQALGERADHLEKAGLDVRVQSQPMTYVRADGRLLWRVLDNLLSNCARYALPNSRVYITVTPENETVSLTIKNISAVELNISAEDLMQRFTRGDRSRHTEGSGLGLSIAQSLAGLMGGTCRVEIDGDLFKASVAIPKWEEA